MSFRRPTTTRNSSSILDVDPWLACSGTRRARRDVERPSAGPPDGRARRSKDEGCGSRRPPRAGVVDGRWRPDRGDRTASRRQRPSALWSPRPSTSLNSAIHLWLTTLPTIGVARGCTSKGGEKKLGAKVVSAPPGRQCTPCTAGRAKVRFLTKLGTSGR